jgi:hypothetical protein
MFFSFEAFEFSVPVTQYYARGEQLYARGTQCYARGTQLYVRGTKRNDTTIVSVAMQKQAS